MTKNNFSSLAQLDLTVGGLDYVAVLPMALMFCILSSLETVDLYIFSFKCKFECFDESRKLSDKQSFRVNDIDKKIASQKSKIIRRHSVLRARLAGFMEILCSKPP